MILILILIPGTSCQLSHQVETCPPGNDVNGCLPCPEGYVNPSCNSPCQMCPVVEGVKTYPNSLRTRCIYKDENSLTTDCRGSLAVQNTLVLGNRTVVEEKTFDWKVYVMTRLSFFRIKTAYNIDKCMITFNTGTGMVESRSMTKELSMRVVNDLDLLKMAEPISDVNSEFDLILSKHNQDLRINVRCDPIGIMLAQFPLKYLCGGGGGLCRSYLSPVKYGNFNSAPIDVAFEISFKYWQDVVSFYEPNPTLCYEDNHPAPCP
jgi:hypothetical protein